MKKSSLYLILAVASLVTDFSLYWGYHKQPEIKETRDTTIIRDTIWKDTTIIEKQIVPKEVIKKKVDTLYLKDGKDTLFVTESKMFDKRLTTSQDTCDLQIYTTGINTSLDSLKWRLKTHNVNTTEIVEITKYVEKKKRFGIGPTVSFGYDPLRKEWGALIGVGININL